MVLKIYCPRCGRSLRVHLTQIEHYALYGCPSCGGQMSLEQPSSSGSRSLGAAKGVAAGVAAGVGVGALTAATVPGAALVGGAAGLAVAAADELLDGAISETASLFNPFSW